MSQTAAAATHKANIEHDVSDKTLFGFWVYIMTDCLIFGSLFATYAVLQNNTYGGPGAAELFSLPFVLTETIILLTSSFTAGLAILALHKKATRQLIKWLVITFLLGLAFLGMELYEFYHLAQDGHSWRASGFLTGFFTLVGTHGVHIIGGLIWIGVLISQIKRRGLNAHVTRRLMLWSLFWHFLDIVWIFIFTFVFLMGAAA